MRRTLLMSATVLLSVALTPGVAAAATVDVPCNNTGDHCYAVRTQGLPATGLPTLNNVTSTTAWVRANCQFASDAGNGFANSEIWQGTPSDLTGGRLEWVEAGITTGTFNGVAGAANIDFFWARQYGSGSTVNYNEFLLLGSDPLTGTNYIHTIRYVSGRGWRIFHGTAEVGGGSANAAPGAHQWVEAGAETALLTDGNSGVVSHISRVTNGSTVNGLTGDVLVSLTGYNIATAGSTEIRFATDSSSLGTCRTVPAARLGRQVATLPALDGADAARAQVRGVLAHQGGTGGRAAWVRTSVSAYEAAFPDQAGTISRYLAASAPLVVTKVTGTFSRSLRHPAGTRPTPYDTIVSVWSPTLRRTVSNAYSLGTAPELRSSPGARNYLDLRLLGTPAPVR